MKIGLYAGSFDPITKGHLWVIQEAAKLFDYLIVAVGVNPNKKGRFSIDQRCEMIEDAIPTAVGEEDKDRIRVSTFSELYTVNYADTVRATHLVRGIRNQSDFLEECTIQDINAQISKATGATHFPTIYLMPPAELAAVSSSVAKSLVGFEASEKVLENYLPTSALTRFCGHARRTREEEILQVGERLGLTEHLPFLKEILTQFYRQPWRFYHTLAHIEFCVMYLESVGGHLLAARRAMYLAFLFHDAIYCADSKENEEKSAFHARAWLSRMNDPDASLICSFILLTAPNAVGPTDEAGKYFLDIDYAILGQDEVMYQRYAEQVKKEYCFYCSESVFNRGRTKFLYTLLQKKKIFRTEHFQKLLEKQARKNMEQELNNIIGT